MFFEKFLREYNYITGSQKGQTHNNNFEVNTARFLMCLTILRTLGVIGFTRMKNMTIHYIKNQNFT